MPTATDAPMLDLTGEPTPVRRLVRDLVQSRDLLPMLARQHFRGQFRAARLGLAWSALQPIVRGAVLAVVFTQVVRIETDVPYPAFVMAGSAAWAFLSGAVVSGTTGITDSASLAGRVYFPRLLLTAMPGAAAAPSYLITLVVVVGLMLGYGVTPTATLLVLPAVLALQFLLVAALSSVLGLLHVYFRDVGKLVTTGIGVLFYATPVIYPADRAGRLRWLLDLNPFSGAVASLRWSLFGRGEDVGASVLSTIAWTTVLAVVAVVAFRRHERICVDRL